MFCASGYLAILAKSSAVTVHESGIFWGCKDNPFCIQRDCKEQNNTLKQSSIVNYSHLMTSYSR